MKLIKNIANFWVAYQLQDPKAPHQRLKAFFLIQNGTVKGGYFIDREDGKYYNAVAFLDLQTRRDIIHDTMLRFEGKTVMYGNKKAHVEIGGHDFMIVVLYGKYDINLDFKQYA